MQRQNARRIFVGYEYLLDSLYLAQGYAEMRMACSMPITYSATSHTLWDRPLSSIWDEGQTLKPLLSLEIASLVVSILVDAGEASQLGLLLACEDVVDSMIVVYRCK